ncbi:MAG: hypothetical protein JNL05_14975 [Flavobacteriales bacterium]|nr:hypothetical protein [Flavobacteriales bacterium]
MRSALFTALSVLALTAGAQYGTFDPKAVAAAKATTTLVVLDAGDSPYNRAVQEAMKAHWKFTKGYDIITVNDLATMPIMPDKTYLLKTKKSDQEKHDGYFMTLVQGWKQKKGEQLDVVNNAITNLPPAQELAFLMIDPNTFTGQGGAMVNVYVKCMQDYLKQVESGKIKDKATADRLYESRNRFVKDMDLWIAKEQLDKSIPDAAKAKETYTKQLQLMGQDQLYAAAYKGEPGIAIGDVVMTGEYKTKWCFRRVFNASTGELMYLRDEAALHGKKEGFIADDLRILEQSR